MIYLQTYETWMEEALFPAPLNKLLICRLLIVSNVAVSNGKMFIIGMLIR